MYSLIFPYYGYLTWDIEKIWYRLVTILCEKRKISMFTFMFDNIMVISSNLLLHDTNKNQELFVIVSIMSVCSS